jgi:hypothetical protein
VELVSGGWDDNIFLWDLRMNKVARHFHGIHTCGESIDSKGEILVCGNHMPDDQIKIYNMGDGR